MKYYEILEELDDCVESYQASESGHFNGYANCVLRSKTIEEIKSCILRLQDIDDIIEAERKRREKEEREHEATCY